MYIYIWSDIEGGAGHFCGLHVVKWDMAHILMNSYLYIFLLIPKDLKYTARTTVIAASNSKRPPRGALLRLILF